MIQNIHVISRRAAEGLVNTCSFRGGISYALLSINGHKNDLLVPPNKELSLLTRGCVGILSLFFDDIGEAEYRSVTNKDQKKNLILFNKDHAHDVILFIEEFKYKTEDLIIHCEAGESRSGACGVFACRFLGLDEKKFYLNNPQVRPNPHILDVLNEVSGLKDQYQNFWDNTSPFPTI